MSQRQIKRNHDAIAIMDTVMHKIINKSIDQAFLEKTFAGKFDQELYSHLISKWESQEEDFFRYYLDAGDDQKRLILEACGITVEPDKYPDYTSRIMAQFEGRKNDEIFPFETYELHKFCLFCYNNSLTVLAEISDSAWKIVTDKNINQYGNTLNWATWWTNADIIDKERFLEYIKRSDL